MATRKQPEALARIRIDNMLVALGWQLDDDDKHEANVRLEGHLKDDGDVAKLGQDSPDYVLYADNSINPIAIIEAKRPNEELQKALAQGMRYAQKMQRENIVVFASDGNITICKHASGRSVTINKEPVDDLLPQWQVEKLAMNPHLELGQEIESISTLIKIFKEAGNDLRRDGVDAGRDSLIEFCLVLFIKIMSERKNGSNNEWDSLTQKSGDSLLAAYKQIIARYKATYGDIFSEVKITRPQTLERIINRIARLNFRHTSLDIKGGAYEHFLSRYSAGDKSGLGQYFTPRHITRMMAQLLNLKVGETIYDPFCGTGGMLVACYGLIRNQIDAKAQAELKRLNNHTLYGGDITESASRLAKMNMVILGDGHSNIKRIDSLSNPVNKKYDCVITNIPFNLTDMPDIDAVQKYGTHDSPNGICIRHCLQSIKDGGRAAIIVPDNIAYDQEYKTLRQFVANHCTIKAVIWLPRATFKNYTSARTVILLLDNIWVGKTTSFPFVKISSDGYSADAWREPIPENDIPELLAHANQLRKRYPIQKISSKNCFIFLDNESPAQTNDADGTTWALSELIDPVVKTTKLVPDVTYYEPRLNGSTNTVSPKGNGRKGMNIKKPEKVIAQKGDLMIATLHTQAKLFAYCDQPYITTSQIVAKVKEDKVNKAYLKYALRQVLPTLSTNDLVGRETYSKEQILSLRIPKPSAHLMQAFKAYEDAVSQAEAQLQAAIKKGKKKNQMIRRAGVVY